MFNTIVDNCQRIIQNTKLTDISNKKVLVTGASGLIGIHLVKSLALLEQGNEIVCIVNNPLDTWFSSLLSHKNITIITKNLADSTHDSAFWQKYKTKFDIIIHAAGYGQPAKFTNDKISTIILNTDITRQLFSCLNTDGIFLFCSTSEIYSGLTKENITENDIGNTSTNHPRSCYIESKRCGEAICYGMHEQYGKNVKIARISSVYGPGTKKNDQRVMSELIKKAICDKKIELIDSGSSIRTFGYVTDIVEMLFNILLQSKDITYNVTGITEISIAKLAEYICDYTKCPLSIPSSGNTLIGNPQRVSISIDKYQQEFNKISFVSIEHGLKNTIQYLEGLYV